MKALYSGCQMADTGLLLAFCFFNIVYFVVRIDLPVAKYALHSMQYFSHLPFAFSLFTSCSHYKIHPKKNGFNAYLC